METWSDWCGAAPAVMVEPASTPAPVRERGQVRYVSTAPGDLDEQSADSAALVLEGEYPPAGQMRIDACEGIVVMSGQ